MKLPLLVFLLVNSSFFQPKLLIFIQNLLYSIALLARKIKNFKPVFPEKFYEKFKMSFESRLKGLQYDISENPVR